MRILVVSDTHGNFTTLLKAYESAGNVDAIIHLGDGEEDTGLLDYVESCPVIKIAGNCDLGSTAPRELILEWHQKKIFICHGDRYGVKNSLSRLIERGVDLEANAVLFGHTHIATHYITDNMMVLNPGTLWGRAPFLSYAIMEVTKEQIKADIYKLT